MKLSQLFERLLLEKFIQKNKFTKLTNASDLEDYDDEIYKLIKNAYKGIGGHHKFNSPSDIIGNNINIYVVADTDSDPELDVVSFGKSKGGKTKLSGIGHDGEKSNIKKLLSKVTNDVKTGDWYAEVSGKAYDSLVRRGNLKPVENEELVRKIVNKPIKWYGEHPTKSHDTAGWYEREIGGKKHFKTLLYK